MAAVKAAFRYRKLGYVALNMPAPETSLSFYRDVVGLDHSGSGEDGAVFLRCSGDHHNIVLYPASRPGLKRIGWELENEATLEKAFAYFSKRGLAPSEMTAADCAALCQGPGFRVRQPQTGVLFEYYATMGQMGAPYQAREIAIARLGHVVLYAASWQETIDSLVHDFNFRISDYVDGMIAFMRCFPNPFHHSLAVSNGGENRLNHVNFMAAHLDDVGRAFNKFQNESVPVVFGPGRHPPSGSVFLYFLDPNGITLEFSAGMEEFPERNPRKPRLLDPSPRSIDFWGGRPQPDFARVGDIEGAL